MSKDKYLHARVVNDSRFLIPMGLVESTSRSKGCETSLCRR